jgi:hypothetical protein
MWTPWISERELFVLSLTAIALLLLASDLAPPQISGFGDLRNDGEEIFVVCALVDLKRTDDGWILTLMDPKSVTVRGFCPEALMPSPFPEGTILEVKAITSFDPDPFLFIRGISLRNPSEGKI